MANTSLYLGLMSGTSADGIDLALVDCHSQPPKLVASFYQAYDQKLRTQITRLYQPDVNEIDLSFALSSLLAETFAKAVNQFLDQQELTAEDICALGNHGQTIRHRPNLSHPFTLQIGCDQKLAALTGIRVIGQFRQKDIALGGQGAPLVPAFHQALFGYVEHDVILVNIGGIANLTYLPSSKTKQVVGYDTGPGNALLDAWISQHQNLSYDKNGRWANSGRVSEHLLNKLLTDDYFHQPHPKSTGREYFNLNWLEHYLTEFTLSPQDIQATLSMLTAQTISQEIKRLSGKAQVILCGGGEHNHTLVNQLFSLMPNHQTSSSQELGLNSDAFEAMAFAWLAYAFDKKITGNLPSVTGADRACVLGIEFTP